MCKNKSMINWWMKFKCHAWMGHNSNNFCWRFIVSETWGFYRLKLNQIIWSGSHWWNKWEKIVDNKQLSGLQNGIPEIRTFFVLFSKARFLALLLLRPFFFTRWRLFLTLATTVVIVFILRALVVTAKKWGKMLGEK
jgi:hypothetical protein